MTDTNSKAQVTDALEWYQEQANAMARHTLAANTNAIEALVTCLALDGGRRAALALAAQEKPEPGVAVAWQVKDFADGWVTTTNYPMVESLQRQGHAVRPLYLHPAPSASPAIPDGWKLVPVEPTREMWAAMADTLYGYKNRHHDKVAGDLYRAMLAVAPSPDLPEGEVEKSHLAGCASCCHCGHIVDTRETKDGGDRFGAQLSDKRWTCSFECWEAIVDPPTSPSPIDKGEVK